MIQLLTRFAANPPAGALTGSTPCDLSGGGLLAFPHWYKFLQGVKDANGKCIPQISALNDVWLIVAAVLEILLRVASILAVGVIIWAGIQFILSQGEPDKSAKARDTIFNALIGLALSVTAAFMVSFVAGRFN